MSDDNKRQIGYRPDIEYVDEYYSEINKDDTSITDQVTQGTTEEITGIEQNPNNDIIQNNMNRIETKIDLLPAKLQSVVKNVYDPIRDIFTHELLGKPVPEFFSHRQTLYNVKTDELVTPGGIETDPETGEMIVDPEAFWGVGDSVDIHILENNVQKAIENSYIKNVTDLLHIYLEELDGTLSRFWFNSLTQYYNNMNNDSHVMEKDLTMKRSEIKNGYNHMVEFCRKNEISKHVKSDFSLKLFNYRETITHLKGFKVAYEFKQRYSQSEFKSNGDKTDSFSDNILEGMMNSADMKYDKAFERAYKYLLSSVDVLDDVLKSFMQEIKSKDIMVKRGK